MIQKISSTAIEALYNASSRSNPPRSASAMNSASRSHSGSAASPNSRRNSSPTCRTGTPPRIVFQAAAPKSSSSTLTVGGTRSQRSSSRPRREPLRSRSRNAPTSSRCNSASGMTRNSRKSVDKLGFHHVVLGAAQREPAGAEAGEGEEHQSREEEGVVEQPKIDARNGEECQQHTHNRFARNQP